MALTWQIAAIWMGLALLAALIAIRVGMPAALIEICVGFVGGNLLGLASTDWIDFLAGFGAILLTFLAGAEIDPELMRTKWKVTLGIGLGSFLAPFVGAMAFAYWVAGWSRPGAEIAGLAMATTSVAMVYAAIMERGYNETDLGKVMLAACFVTDVTTVLALGLLFARFDWWLLAFAAVTAVSLWRLPAITSWFFDKVGRRIVWHETKFIGPEMKFILLILFALGALATAAESEAILPAFLVGMVLAPVFLANRVLTHRLQGIAFSVVTPFFFLKAGMLVSAKAALVSAVMIGIFLAIKMAGKFLGIWPLARAFLFTGRECTYLCLMMSTGIMFGSVAALYGLSHGFISREQYAILVTAVILSAVVPTVIAERWCTPGAFPVPVDIPPKRGVA